MPIILMVKYSYILITYDIKLTCFVSTLFILASLLFVIFFIIICPGLDFNFLFMEGGTSGGGGSTNPVGGPSNPTPNNNGPGNNVSHTLGPQRDGASDQGSDNSNHTTSFQSPSDIRIRSEVLQNGFDVNTSQQPYARNLIIYAESLPNQSSQIPTGLESADAEYITKMHVHYRNVVMSQTYDPNKHYAFTRPMRA